MLFTSQDSPALTSFFFITGLISFVLSFFNLIFELCRRRCRLKGLPLRKPKPYCNRPRSNVLSNSPRQRIRLLSARRNRSKANKSTHRRNCRRRLRGQRYASRTSLKNTLRRSLTACPTSCYRLRKDFRGALSQRLWTRIFRWVFWRPICIRFGIIRLILILYVFVQVRFYVMRMRPFALLYVFRRPADYLAVFYNVFAFGNIPAISRKANLCPAGILSVAVSLTPTLSFSFITIKSFIKYPFRRFLTFWLSF